MPDKSRLIDRRRRFISDALAAREEFDRSEVGYAIEDVHAGHEFTRRGPPSRRSGRTLSLVSLLATQHEQVGSWTFSSFPLDVPIDRKPPPFFVGLEAVCCKPGKKLNHPKHATRDWLAAENFQRIGALQTTPPLERPATAQPFMA